MFVSMISRSGSKLGLLGRKLGHQAISKYNLDKNAEVTFFEVIIMSHALNVCLDGI